jgi:hypothetical protein
MSNNSRNNSLHIQLLSELLQKLAGLTIRRAEKIELEEQLNLLRSHNKLTQGEYDILFTMLNTISSTETRNIRIKQLDALNNVNKITEERKLFRPLNINQIYFIRSILLKLQRKLSTQFFISRTFSGKFPNGLSFQDFVISKSYKEHPIIGKGGFGEVFRLDFPDHPSFVLKEIILLNDRTLISVQNEVEALKHVIGKWYAVQLLAAAILIDESLTLDRIGVAYILYPFIPGTTLEVYQDVAHPEEEEKEIYRHIIEAVQQLHTNTGLLHSDIKPENIWIPTEHHIRPFLLDFGLIQSLQNPIALNRGTPFYWSEKRFHSKGKSKQTMTPGINWLALARTLSGEFSNHNSHPLLSLPLRKRFRNLYHVKNENTIRKNHIDEALTGIVRQPPRIKLRGQRMNRSIRQNNGNRNRNRNTKKNNK